MMDDMELKPWNINNSNDGWHGTQALEQYL